MIHSLKIAPKYFLPVKNGKKKFEIRQNDRNFKIDDIVVLKEWNEKDGFTGQEVKGKITYITDFAQQDNFVVFGLQLIDYKS